MKLVLYDRAMSIVPESVQDRAFLEYVFNLREEGDTALCVRMNACKLSSIGSVEIRPKERE